MLSVRREREHRRTGRAPICSTCRRPPHPKPTEDDREWWLERFTLAEIVELADAIWGDALEGGRPPCSAPLGSQAQVGRG